MVIQEVVFADRKTRDLPVLWCVLPFICYDLGESSCDGGGR